MPENRPTLVLIPGLLCDAELWGDQTAQLSDIADVRVAGVRAYASIADMADAILADAPEAFNLAGHSMGGYVAQDVIRRAPARVRRLALVNTSARADTEAQAIRRKGLLELATKGKFKGVTPRLVPQLIAKARQGDAALVDRIMKMTERVGRDAFLAQQTAILGRADGRADLAAISCPTLIVAGREDALTPVKVHEEMAAAIPGARLAVVEDSGHLAPMEQPQAVTALLRRWLRQ